MSLKKGLCAKRLSSRFAVFPEHTANKFRVSAASMPSSESEVFRERRRGKRARDEDGRRALPLFLSSRGEKREAPGAAKRADGERLPERGAKL